MASDRPEVSIRPGFSVASVSFEVSVTNTTPGDLRELRLSPRPIPPSTWLDRESHLIPLLQPRRSRTVAFRLRPEPGQQVVALDLTVEWEDAYGTRRGRLDVSSRPVEMICPKLTGPRESMDRWRSGLSGGTAVVVRLRQRPSPGEILDSLEEAMEGAPGEVNVQRDEGPRGPMGRVWVRAEGARGRRAGLLVDVTPDPASKGSRVLVTATANTEELLTMFYHTCITLLVGVLPGVDSVVPHSLSELQ
jgi:hypothetical protein